MQMFHWLKNAVALFQANIPQWFNSLYKVFKSYLDDFIKFAEDVSDLLEHLDSFFK